MNKVLVAGLIGVGVYALANVARIPSISVNITGLLLSPPRLKFDIANPTSIPIKVNSIIADLVIQGNRVATLNDFTPYEIAPNSHITVYVKIAGDLIGFVGLINNVLQSGYKNFMMDVSGFINVHGVPVSFYNHYKVT